MDWTVCSRETERDYTWDTTHAGPVSAKNAQRFFAPAFEGSITRSRFAALLRSPNSPQGVILCVSVSTNRRDFSRTPIRTLTVLRAETPEETGLLAAFFAECLRKPDKETLYNPESKITQAVESLYQTKKTNEFLAFCKSLKPIDGKGGAPENRWAIPRNDEGERKSLADALPAAITGNSSFLFALTDRLPTDVLASLGSMFDRGTVRIFSKAAGHAEQLPEPVSQKYGRAATIGEIVVLSILFVAAIDGLFVAAIDGPCSGRNGVVATNAPASDGIGVTNAVPTEGRRVKPAREAWQCGVFTNAAPTSTETKTSVTNEADSPILGGSGESEASTHLLPRAIDGEAVSTNAPTSGGISSKNAVPTEGRSIEPVRETRPGGVSSNAAPASSETPAAVTNNPAESPAIRNGEAK